MFKRPTYKLQGAKVVMAGKSHDIQATLAPEGKGSKWKLTVTVEGRRFNEGIESQKPPTKTAKAVVEECAQRRFEGTRDPVLQDPPQLKFSNTGNWQEV